jgi:hypothetical protein
MTARKLRLIATKSLTPLVLVLNHMKDHALKSAVSGSVAGLRLVPINPDDPVSGTNVFLVTYREQRTLDEAGGNRPQAIALLVSDYMRRLQHQSYQ